MSNFSFSYKNNLLGLNTPSDWQSLLEFTSRQENTHYGEAFYIYNLSSVKQRVSAYKNALQSVNLNAHFALKSNTNKDILKVVHENQFGIDAVSMGEIKHALDHNFEPNNIILSGVGKSQRELTFSIENGIKQINVESLAELKRLGEICKSLNKKCRFGIRINPDIKVETHPYISTGFRENKFGIPEEQLNEAVRITKKYSPYLDWHGLSVHIGSQILDLLPLIDSCKALLRIYRSLKLMKIDIRSLDMGGGIGIDYKTNDESVELDMINKYGKKICELLKDYPGEVMIEPGRSLVGRCGALLTQVEYVKSNGFKEFVIVNTGMNHLLRPSLYQAFHRILPVERFIDRPIQNFDVVGPICESSDVLGYDRRLPTPRQGEWLAVMDAGAYGHTMSSNYNLHSPPKEYVL